MTHGSLFSGIGGFDLAAEWMGWENKFHCEWNEFGQKVLHYYWPNVELFTDITKSDFTKYANKIDVLTGGFPCQPYSQAGKRLGKEDDRHLWPEMLRAIREIKPSWVVGENVYGLVNWNGGLVFHEVQSDLEAEGYEVFPVLLPAAAVNAPHRRDRIWFIAHSKCSGHRGKSKKNRPNITRSEWNILSDIGQHGNKIWSKTQQCSEISSNANSNGQHISNSKYEINTNQGGEYAQHDIEQSNDNGNASDTKQQRLQRPTTNGQISKEKRNVGRKGNKSTIGITSIHTKSDVTNTNGIGLRRQSNRIGESKFISKNEQRNKWETFPTVSPICNGDDGLSDRLDSITFSKWRNESIKAGGNAIVPQVVYQIFKAIEQYEQQRPSNTTN